jgi:imidazolonepropionase-like amidohydrolase
MRRYLALLPLLLCACKPSEQGHMKAIVGAVMIDGRGGPPLSNSIVVIDASAIREAGPSSAVPIPDEADKINGAGKFLVPGLVDVCPSAEPPGIVRATSADDARSQVGALIAANRSPIYVGKMPPAAIQAALEAARESTIPAIGLIATRADAQVMVDKGATALVGMIRDTEDLDAALLNRLRDLRIVVAPALAAIPPGPELDLARRNTKRMFDSGVLLAAASAGADLLRETEALAAAGIPPLDIIVAATQHSALALRQTDAGTIQAGHRADLIMLSANPGEDIRNLARVAGRVTAGVWTEK